MLRMLCMLCMLLPCLLRRAALCGAAGRLPGRTRCCFSRRCRHRLLQPLDEHAVQCCPLCCCQVVHPLQQQLLNGSKAPQLVLGCRVPQQGHQQRQCRRVADGRGGKAWRRAGAGRLLRKELSGQAKVTCKAGGRRGKARRSARPGACCKAKAGMRQRGRGRLATSATAHHYGVDARPAAHPAAAASNRTMQELPQVHNQTR